MNHRRFDLAWMSVVIVLFTAGAIPLAAAAEERDAELSPDAREAVVIGPLTAHFVGQGGSGVVSVTLPNGDVLHGQYSMTGGACSLSNAAEYRVAY
jgi:hypothetical protein